MIDHFAARLLDWFDRHGRHDLPWQSARSRYRVWISEVMLQQTQVATVIPYYRRFLARFPDLPSLAAAAQDEVLAIWSGLGYYSRARNLQAAAQHCVERHRGNLPGDPDALTALPGIGRSTAAAILAQADGARHAILDGNVKRVLCRLFAIDGWPGSAAVENRLWPLAESLLPEARLADYTQAIMDFGATLCTRGRPDCAACPFGADCAARREGRIAELPAPRPSRALPQRDCVMLLLENHRGELLLERRGPAGVWAGLWCLPQFDDIDAARAWRGDSEHERSLPVISHAFSHYRLRIAPLHCRMLGAPQHIRDNESLRWTAPDAIETIGLPAPVRRLLQAHCDRADAATT